MNMMALFCGTLFGIFTRRKWRLLLLYIVTGIWLVWLVVCGDATISVGTSGAIFGLAWIMFIAAIIYHRFNIKLISDFCIVC